MHLQTPQLALTNLLGSDKETVVVVTKANFTRQRMMQSEDGQIVFEQRAEEDGEWLLTDYLEPSGSEAWPHVVMNAKRMGFKTPEADWLGQCENIPDALLLGDEPLWVRRVDEPGWMDLRMVIKKNCEGQA